MKKLFRQYAYLVSQALMQDSGKEESTYIDRLDDMAYALGYDIDWEHDPRPVQEIIQSWDITRPAHRKLRAVVRALEASRTHFKELWDEYYEWKKHATLEQEADQEGD